MTERWVPLWGTNPDYMVSDLGRVRSHRPKTVKENGGEPYVMSPMTWKRTGYQFFKVNSEIHSHHSIVYYSFAGHRPYKKKDRLEVNHKDGDKTNNTLSNLELVTHAENHQHRCYVLRQTAWGNPSIETTVTVKSTGEVLTYPSIRAMKRAHKLNEVYVHE